MGRHKPTDDRLKVVFDLDDTLLPNRWRYGKAGCLSGSAIVEALGQTCRMGSAEWLKYELAKASFMCGAIIVDTLGNDTPYVPDLLKRARDGMDRFDRDAFLSSWLRTYEQICKERNREIDPKAVAKIHGVMAKFGRKTYQSALAEIHPDDRSFYGVELAERQSSIDDAMVMEYGFGQHRFPDSWVLTYEAVSLDAGIQPCAKVTRRIQRIAAGFRRGPFRAFPDAIDALHRIQGMGHSLFLVTAGEKRLQLRKVKQSGLEVFFENRIHVVERDKRPALKAIADGKPRRTVMVGDSLRSDMAAAIDVGIKAVLIPTAGQWQYDQADVDESAYIHISSIQELPDLIVSIVADEASRRRKYRRKAQT